MPRARYKQAFTMEQIATQLSVSQRTISTDLKGLEVASKPSRPEGGRPKGSGKCDACVVFEMTEAKAAHVQLLK
jgi:DeoR/GlpR family transcriptional regulator of sugar metabolism